MYQTKVVGVTFEGRQKVVASLKHKEILRLIREPDNVNDANAIRVERMDGVQVGYINKVLAAEIANKIDQCKEDIYATVVRVAGGEGYNYGVTISFKLSEHTSIHDYTLESIVDLCNQDRIKMGKLLLNGSFFNWFENIFVNMRQHVPEGIADEYEAALIGMQIVSEEVAFKDRDSFVEQQLALERWLGTLPYYVPSPLLEISPNKVECLPEWIDHSITIILKISNHGTGIIVGSIKSDVSWIKVINSEFICVNGKDAEINANIITPEFDNDQGNIIVSILNSGEYRITVLPPKVKIHIKTYPEILDFGKIIPYSSQNKIRTFRIQNDGNILTDLIIDPNLPNIISVEPDALSLERRDGANSYYFDNVNVLVHWDKIKDINQELYLTIDFESDTIKVPIIANFQYPK
ncbi:MAG: HIRAN domain-containing protein [Desulfamplus sp.]|nr:HIRAN domain-containing protein [Desulfamplus sp.]